MTEKEKMALKIARLEGRIEALESVLETVLAGNEDTQTFWYPVFPAYPSTVPTYLGPVTSKAYTIAGGTYMPVTSEDFDC